LPEDKLAGDLGNVIGATSIDGRRSDFFTARKLAPGNLGLLQQYLPLAGICSATKSQYLFDHLVGKGEQSWLRRPIGVVPFVGSGREPWRYCAE
jgi:hypothetical protein